MGNELKLKRSMVIARRGIYLNVRSHQGYLATWFFVAERDDHDRSCFQATAEIIMGFAPNNDLEGRGVISIEPTLFSYKLPGNVGSPIRPQVDFFYQVMEKELLENLLNIET